MASLPSALVSAAVFAHVARNAPIGAFKRILDQSEAQFPSLVPYISLVPQLLVFPREYVESITPERAAILIGYIVFIARTIELCGTAFQVKVATETMTKTFKALRNKPPDKNPMKAIMKSICILNENQIRISKLQLILHVATTNLMTCLNSKSEIPDTDYDYYNNNISALNKELDIIARSTKIGACVNNLENGIPIPDIIADSRGAEEVDRGGFLKNKTGKRKNKSRTTSKRKIK